MALLAAQKLSGREGASHQADALIHLDVVSEYAGLADNSAGAMVHEEMRADLRARMQIHPGPSVGPLGHDARNEGNILQVQFVREPLYGDSFDERVSHNDFLFAERCRVAIVGRFRIGLKQLAEARQAGQEFHREQMRDRSQALLFEFGRRVILQAFIDFIFQFAQHRIHQRRGFHLDFGRVNWFFVEKTGKQKPQQIGANDRDGASGRKILAIQMIDAARVCIGGDQAIS